MKKILLTLFFLLITLLQTNSQTIHKLDSVHLFSWDINSLDWSHHTREILSFDNLGNKETNYLRLNLSSSIWNNFYQTLNKYDTNNNVIEKVFQTWDSNVSNWKNGTKDSINYTGSQKESEFKYLYFSDKWNQNANTSYTYNSGKLIEELQQKNNPTFTSMINNLKFFYIYNGDLLIEKIEQDWLDWASIWENDQKVIYDYQSGKLIKETTVNWSTSMQDWGANGYKETTYLYNTEGLISEAETRLTATNLGVDKFIYSYDTNESVTVHQLWYSAGSDFRNFFKHIRTFNENEKLSEHISQKWDTTNDVWNNDTRRLYFWSETTDAFSLTVDKQPELISANVFPIPAKNNINIHFSKKINMPSTLYFYDINGKEFLKKNISVNQQKVAIKIPAYNGTLFFLKIKNNLGSSTYKVLIDK